MHGRVKVRTSEEEKARKEKERQEKLKVFKHAMQKIQLKRKQGELDNELLDITGKVLTSNPDIYTLWNIRREIIELLSKSNKPDEELSQIYDAELQLTEYCLKINPKSYCAWHQREWVLTTRPNPDWKKELALCNTYLKYDERNFHTWDYRRFVVKHSKPPLVEEFDYTTEKLHENFSNYSAWHYRSKMLVELYPDLEGGRPIQDNHHKHELKLIQSAAFTDPDDTSAWFYQRWLLGAVKTTIRMVVATVSPTKTTVAFSKPVSKDILISKTKLLLNGAPVNGEWYSCINKEKDNLWIFKHHEIIIMDDLSILVEYQVDDKELQIITCKKYNEKTYIGKADINFQKKYSEPVVEELSKQLESCRQLLALEPDSKWTLLTTTVFLHCINSKLFLNEVKENLEILKTIDKLRYGYYDDLLSKWSIEDQLVEDYCKSDTNLKFKFQQKISCLPHLQYYSYCDNVDMSDHNLTSKLLPSLILLQNCKRLNLSNNKLTTLKGFPKLQLEELDLRGNVDLQKEDIELIKKDCGCRVIF